jgi:putative sigma-54 modulation protein
MNIKITGKELKATDAIKNYINEKVDRIQKYFNTEDVDLFVTIKKEGDDQVAEMQVSVMGESFRAVTASKDLYASIDKNMDILEGQIRKMKTKKDKQNMTESIRLKEENRSSEEHEVSDEIIKTIYYSIKPMGPEDAKLLLEDQPQNKFLTFLNIETGKVNVIYRLKDNKNYGLIEPEA